MNILFKRLLTSKSGEGYIDVIVIIISAMLVIALAIKVFPVFIAKHQLNTFASELCRTAEIEGQIGTETNKRIAELQIQIGIKPSLTWSGNYISGTQKIQLNNSIEVTVSHKEDIGLFGNFGSFPIMLTSRAGGRSEVYWK